MNIHKSLVIKRFIPIFVIGFVFCIAQVSTASGQGIINEILARMDAHNKSLTSLRANVTKVDVNSQLGTSDTREGKVAYRPMKARNPAVRIDWVSPVETLSVIDKKYVIYRPALKQVYTGSTESRKTDQRAGGALAFMNMSRAQLKANYDIRYMGEESVKGGTKTWHLELTPKSKTTYKVADIWVNGNGMPVQSKITEQNNDSTTVLLTNLQPNATVEGKEFVIKWPSGTKEIKG